MTNSDFFMRAYNSFRVGDYSTAEQHIRTYLEQNPDSDEGYVLLGNICARSRRYSEAAAAYRTAIETNPENREALNDLGVVCRMLGRNEESLAAFRAALKLAPDDATVHYNIGNVYKQTGDLQGAESAYRNAVAHEPELSTAWNNLGTLLQSQGKLSEAIAVFRDGLVSDPNHPGLHYNLGLACEQAGELENAIAEYRLALRSRPGWVDALNNLAILLQKTGDLSGAAANLHELLKIDGSHAVANNNLGTIQAQLGRPEEARRNYRAALEVNPGYERALRNLTQLLRSHPQLPGVAEELAALVESRTDDVELRFALADVCMHLDRLAEAETELTEILGFDPEDVEALRMLGAVYFRQGRRDSADECFQHIEELSPGSDQFRLDVARLHYQAGEYEEAVAQAETYLREHAHEREATLLRAEALIELGRFGQAIEVLQGARDHLPDDGRAIALMARAQSDLGNTAEALKTADELINLQGNRGSDDDLSALNQSLEIYEKAVGALESDVWQQNLNRLSDLIEQVSRDAEARDSETLEVDQTAEVDPDSIPFLGSWGQEFFADEEEEPLRLRDLKVENEPDERSAGAAESARSLLELSGAESQGFRHLVERDEEEVHHRIIRRTTEEVVEPPPEPPPSATAAHQPQAQPQPFAQAGAWAPGASGGGGASSAQPPSGAIEPETPRYPHYDAPFSGLPPQPGPQPEAPQYEHEESVDYSDVSYSAPLEQQPAASHDGSAEQPQAEPPVGAPQSEPEPELEPQPEPVADQPDRQSDLDDLLGAFEALRSAAGETLQTSADTDAAAHEATEAEPHAAAPRRRLTDRAEDTADEKPPGSDPDKRVKLIDYLLRLAESLPPDKRAEFLQSDMRMRMESLRMRLLGKPGLKRDLERYAPRSHAGAGLHLTPKRVSEAMKFVQAMSGYLPDRSLSGALGQRLSQIVTRIEELRGTGK